MADRQAIEQFLDAGQAPSSRAAIEDFLGPPPQREVGPVEAAGRTIAAGAHRGAAGALTAAGGVAAGFGAVPNVVSDALFRAADAQSKAAGESDLQPNESTGMLGKAAEFVAGLPAGVLSIPDTLSGAGREVVQHGGSLADAVKAEVAQVPSAALAVVAPEFGGRVGGMVAKEGAKRLIGKAVGGAAANVVGASAGRAIGNLGLPEDMQQNIAPTIEDVGYGAFGGLFAAKHVSAAERAKMKASATIGATLGSAAKTAGISDELAAAIGRHGAAHAFETEPGDLSTHAHGSIDRMHDSELQNLSPRYAALRKQGLSESEVKASLKSHFTAAVDAYKPKTKGASDVDAAFGGTGASGGAAPEGWGESLIEKPDAGDELVKQLNERAQTASSETAKKILSAQASAMTEAQALLKDANAAGKVGDAKMRAKLLQERAKLFEKHGIDDPHGLVPQAPEPTPEEPQSTLPAERQTSVGEFTEEPGAEPQAAPPSTIDSTAKPVEALPAPPPKAIPAPTVPVTPEGQAMTTAQAEQRARAVKDEQAAKGAAQHPGFTPDEARPQVPPGFDVSKSVGLGGGKSKTGKKGYISRMIPPFLDVKDRNGNTVKIPVWDEIASHENGEFPNIAEKGYDKAHDEHGNAATAKFLEPYNVDPRSYQNALRPHLKAAELDALQHPDNVPADLDHRVYAKPFAETDNTHLLGESHWWNKQHAGKKPVAARAAAREKALKEHADANRNTAESIAERPLPGQRELRPSAEEADQQRPAEAANAVAAPEVGDANASQVRGDQGQADREEAGGERAATPWVPHSEEWRKIQTDAPLKNNTSGRATAAAIEKALNGEKMSVAERRHVLRHLQEIDDTMHADAAQAAADKVRLDRAQVENVDLVRQANELLGEDRVSEIAEKHEDDNEFYSALRREMIHEQHKAEGIPSGEAGAADSGREASGGPAAAGGEQAGLEVSGGEGEAPRLEAADRPENFAMSREQRTPEQADAEVRRQAEVAQQDMLGGKTAEAQAADEAARRAKAENAPDASVDGGLFAKPKGDGMAQRGRAGEGAGADTVRSELESKHGKPGVQSLEKNGLLNIIHSGDMPEGPDTAAIKSDPSIKAYYDGNGKAYLFHDRLDAGEATGALMHELGVHYGARELLGEHGFAKMLDDISALRKGGNKAVQDAWDHVKENYSHDENSHSFKNEVAARLVETEPEMGFVRKLVTAIKAAIYKKTGLTAALDDHVIRKIAADALRSTMDEPHLGRLDQDATEGMFKKGTPQKMREAGQSIGDAIKAVGTKLDGKVSVEQQLGRQGLRAALANVIRADAKVRTKLKDVRDYADRLIGKDPKLARQALEAWETGKPVADPKLAAFFREAQKYGDQMVDQVRATGKEMGYIQNYLPHLYKDPKRAAEFFYNMSQSRPMRSGGFTKERFHATLEEARKAGLEPVSENPVDLFLAHWSQMHKYVEMAKFKEHLDSHGLLRPEADNRYRMPPGWAKVNDPLFNGLMAPEGVAKDINNHVSPGLDQHALWRGFRSAQNMLLTTRLGASLFHAGMTTVDSFLSHSSIGLQRAMIGDVNGAAHSMAKAVGALPQAVTDFFGKGEGSKLVRQFLGVEHVDPTTALIFDKLTRGGARAFMDKTDTNDAVVKFQRAMMQKNGTEAAKAAFGAGVEAMTRNISHKLVPAQKMIARVNLFKLELDRYAEKAGAKRGDYGDIISKMNPDKIDEIAARVNDDVDDRLGQVAYDNLFWNKMVKQAAQASIQSVGWNVGSFRLIFGGLKDIKNLAKPEASALAIDKAGKIKDSEGPRLSSRLAYLLTMNSVLLASNGMLTYLMTGDQPTGKDWWYFRTGAKNADGSDERMALPSYMRDEYGLLNRPLEMVQNKLHPSISMATEIWRNHDYFGDEIRNPLDKWPTQAKQLLSYFVKGIEPYSVQNLQAQTGGGIKDVLPFIGVTKAPGYVNRSDFQQGVMEAAQEQRKSKTPEDRDRSHAVSQAIQAYRSGDPNALKGMDPAEQSRIKSMAKNDIIDYHFKNLPLGTMLNLIEKADPKEIKDRKLVQIINHKMLTPSGRAAMKDMQPDERAAVHARLRELGAAQ